MVLLRPSLEAGTEAKDAKTSPGTEGPWIGLSATPVLSPRHVRTDQAPIDFAKCLTH